LYYFSPTYASLAGVWGDNNAATSIIGGLAPPPPPAGSMAALMGTTLNSGTTVAGCVNGLDAYLENNWDSVNGGNAWNTLYLPSNPFWGGPGGAAFWSILQTEIDNGSGVILAIAWMQGNPTDPAYDTPDDYIPDEYPDAAMGHAVVLVGYDNDAVNPRLQLNDPANNAGMHNWAGEYAWYNVNVGANYLTLNNLGGVQATIYGAIITNIPAPATAALLAAGMACLLRRRA
ncbi:MAG: C39 family peptidase, partial [Phycisphaerales bacterium JB038]